MRLDRLVATVVPLIMLPALSSANPAFPARAVKEAGGIPAESASPPCPLAPNRNGTCANYKWFNGCTGYIWIFDDVPPGTQVGVRFGGPENPCVRPGNTVKRAITYFRGTVPNYGATVNIYIDVDANSDGCRDRTIAQDIGLDPGERWSCSNFNVAIPADAQSLIVRTQLWTQQCNAPSLATDGPYTEACDPIGIPRSFYYGTGGQGICIPWINFSPTGRNDNFLHHLIIDGTPTAGEATSWGSIKAMYE